MTTCVLPVLYITGSYIYGRIMLFNHTLAASWSRQFVNNCNTYFFQYLQFILFDTKNIHDWSLNKTSVTSVNSTFFCIKINTLLRADGLVMTGMVGTCRF
jgi:hypothetical protein